MRVMILISYLLARGSYVPSFPVRHRILPRRSGTLGTAGEIRRTPGEYCLMVRNPFFSLLWACNRRPERYIVEIGFSSYSAVDMGKG